jgi:hypothetical protein
MSSKPSTALGHLDSVAYEVEAALAFHDDDPKAAIATLLADIRHLRSQLALAVGFHAELSRFFHREVSHL